MRVLIKTFLTFVLVCPLLANSEIYANNRLDSLKQELEKQIHDTVRFDLLLEIGDAYYFNDPDLAKEYFIQAEKLADDNLLIFENGLKERFLRRKAKAKHYIAYVYYYEGDYVTALDLYFQVLKIGESMNCDRIIYNCYNNIGMINHKRLEYDVAKEYYYNALEIAEENNNMLGKVKLYNNIGLLYYDIGKAQDDATDKMTYFDDALDMFMQCLDLRIELNDLWGQALAYNNLGSLTRDVALISEDEKQKEAQLSESLDYYFKAIQIGEQINDMMSISKAYENMSELYLIKYDNQNNTPAEKTSYVNNAVNYASESYRLAKKLNSLPQQQTAAHAAKKAYAFAGNNQKALEYANIYIQVSADLFADDKTRSLDEMRIKYETEKKDNEILLLNQDRELRDVKILRQEERGRLQLIIILTVLIGLILISIFLVIVINRLQITRKQKVLIQDQKHLVDEKNVTLNEQNEEIRFKNEEIQHQSDEIAAQRDLVINQKDYIERQTKHITNSIYYAKMIQTAVLPPDIVVDNILGEHFVLFFPKDIVSGDFYWVNKIDDKIIFAVADCTGHGVPGAFMGMLGLSFLKEIVGKQEKTNPAEVLNILRASVIEALQQKGKPTDQREGLDIALCVLDKKTNKLEYAGANSPLIIVRANKSVKIIQPDKQPIAYHRKMKPFSHKSIQLTTGDSLYLASDGYQTQLGGDNYKMFMSKNFYELLANLCEEPMHKQGEILYEKFIQWKKPYEQVDDVTVIGLKI